MKTPRTSIALFGKSLLADDNLKNKLENKFCVFYCKNINQITTTVEKQKIKLLLMEIGQNGRELKLIKKLHIQNPHLRIISIGLDEPIENLIRAFKYGSVDFYKIPINNELLVERIDRIIAKNHLHITQKNN